MTKDEMIKGLRYKAANIKAHMEPEFFTEVADYLEEQKWIPVSERLPKQGESVICQCRANIIKVMKLDANFDWYQDADHCYMNGFVIAWMPLPEACKPKESGGSDADSN